jgi:multidrug efflux pump subunit AcrB
MIRWFARNDIAANFLIVAILLWGGYSVMERVPMEVQPALVFKEVHINVPYRGGSPEDVEKAVVLPIESALEGMQGVKSVVASPQRQRQGAGDRQGSHGYPRADG